MREPMLVCVDPDAIDTHKGRWLEIDAWLEGFASVPEDEAPGRLTVPDAIVAPGRTYRLDVIAS